MKRAGLTQDDFDKLLRWLDPDRDKAGEKLIKIQSRLISVYSSRGCIDPEFVADKTTNIVARKADGLLEHYEGDPALYFYGVAKKVYLEYIKQLRPVPLPPPPPPDPPDTDEVADYLEQCLEKLLPKDRETAVRYQEGEKGERIINRKKLAEELKTTSNALRIRVCHIHARLRKCIERLQRSG